MTAPMGAEDVGRVPTGRREQRKAETRAELLAAGRKFFSEKGLYEARVEDLAATAGIAKGTLYQYFRDKDELVQAVVAAGFGQLADQVSVHMHGARGLADRAGRIAEAHAIFFAENPDLMRVLHQARGLLKFNAERWAGLQHVLEQHVRLLAGHLARPSVNANLTPARRRELAAVLFGAVSGMASVRAALDAAGASGLRPDTARYACAAIAQSWAGGAAPRREPALNARVARQRSRRDRGNNRGNDAKNPDGGAG